MYEQTQAKNEALVEQLLSGKAGEEYLGKQVVVIGGKVFVLPEDDRESVNLVNELEERYPDQIPHLLFVPRPETYVL